MVLTVESGFAPADMVLDRYERESTKIFEAQTVNGMVVVDVGAHVGYYTLIAANLVGSTGKVFAFEPDPTNNRLLIENIKLNGYTNVEVTNFALASKPGVSTLYRTSLDNGRHSLYRHDLPVSGTVEIETITLDAFLESRGWPQVRLVKMDVEGAELEVLSGMEQLLNRSKELDLIIEFNPYLLKNAGADNTDLIESLVPLGFKVSYIDESHGLIPLPERGQASMITRLMEHQESANLLFSRGWNR